MPALKRAQWVGESIEHNANMIGYFYLDYITSIAQRVSMCVMACGNNEGDGSQYQQ